MIYEIQKFLRYIERTRGDLVAALVIILCVSIVFTFLFLSLVITNGYILIAYLILAFWWLYHVYREYRQKNKND